MQEGDAVKWNGQSGWHVDRVVGEGEKTMMELGKMEENPETKKLEYRRHLAYANEVQKEARMAEYKAGDKVMRKGKEGWWDVETVTKTKDGKVMLELGQKYLNEKGQKMHRREIAYGDEVARA